MLNIRRVDHDASSTHCWRVNVQRRTRIFVRDFSDGRHDGRQSAFQAAQVYRDTLVKAYPPPEQVGLLCHSQEEQPLRYLGSNASGYVGAVQGATVSPTLLGRAMADRFWESATQKVLYH